MIQGSVLDPGAVAELIRGVDVVLSVLGSRPKEQMVVAPGTRVVIDVIRSLERKPRLVHMSSLGIGDSWPLVAKFFLDAATDARWDGRAVSLFRAE